MSGPHSAGKGDKPRPVNREKFSRNWDEIDWRKKPEAKKTEEQEFDECLRAMGAAIHLTDPNRR